MVGSIGTQEILLIVGLFVLLFGAASIPKLARSLGRARGEFRKGQTEPVEETKKDEATPEGEKAPKVAVATTDRTRTGKV